MIWLLYNVLFAIGFTLLLPYFLARMWRRGGYRRDFMQRLGWYDAGRRAQLRARPRIWIHAVSVGEVFVAARFMAELRMRRPGTAFVLSTTTSTGHALAEKTLAAEDVLIYFPVDNPLVMRRVLRRLRPEMLILTECELWPNLLRLAHGRGIPLALINGRISDNSFRGYRRLSLFSARIIRMFDVLGAQSRQDADRLIGLGADPSRVTVTGSAKYDVAEKDPTSDRRAGDILRAANISEGQLVMVGGSTWPGEEGVLLEIFGRLKLSIPNLKLVLVPRHAERRQEVGEAIARRGFAFVQRSACQAGNGKGAGAPDVLLVDTTGELKHLYAKATVIFIGKSLTQHGGQNPVEPAAYGKPVIVGPNMENFRDVMNDLLQAGAAIQVRDARELEDALHRLLKDESARRECGRRAAEVVEAKRGAIRSTVGLVLARLPRPAK
jgi:3-deoxy-D-manno-octulosonic-acid transferase